MNENSLNSKNLHYDLMLFHQAMPVNILQQDNAIFYHH